MRYDIIKFILWSIVPVMQIGMVNAQEDCSKLTTQAELNNCYSVEHTKADDVLNKAYSVLRCGLNESQKKDLAMVQRAWIRYRDLLCRFEASEVKGVTSHGMVLSMCLTEKTRLRTKEINALVSCEEGDIACPLRFRNCVPYGRE
jgi:uncharacterized protein YecT (DUF1311 family)